jgi:predicted NBD/HSP70 family sugar kinase
MTGDSVSKSPYAQQRDARQQNASALLRDLWYHAPLAKATLAQRNGLTKATVSAICSDLAALNLIREVGQDKTGVGRPGNLLELNPAARASIGVEISTNYLAAVLTDFRGQPLWKRAESVAPGSAQAALLAQAQRLIDAAIGQAKERDIPLLGIGVGLPGSVDTGQCTVVNAPALGWKDLALGDLWETRFSLPVVVENKARAAAMAEGLHGAAQGAATFVYVTVGTDVRASVDVALVLDGMLYRGAHGLGVDAGHLILDPRGVACSCGQRGCWQAMADVGRETDLVLPRLKTGEPSLLQRHAADGYAGLEHRMIHQAALARDPLALEIVHEVLMNHALGIANLVSLFDPELVVIGFANVALPADYKVRMQSLNAMPELDIAEGVRRQLMSRGVTPPDIRYAAYGPDACTLGAAALLLDRFLRNPPAYEA